MKYEGNYRNVHIWLKNTHGKANKCENSNCENKNNRFTWSKIRGKNYEKKRENFWKLCSKCHRSYDNSVKWAKNIGKSLKGKKFSNEHIRKMKISFRKRIPVRLGAKLTRKTKKKISNSLKVFFKHKYGKNKSNANREGIKSFQI